MHAHKSRRQQFRDSQYALKVGAGIGAGAVLLGIGAIIVAAMVPPKSKAMNYDLNQPMAQVAPSARPASDEPASNPVAAQTIPENGGHSGGGDTASTAVDEDTVELPAILRQTIERGLSPADREKFMNEWNAMERDHRLVYLEQLQLTNIAASEKRR